MLDHGMGSVKLSSFGPSFTSVFLGVEDHGLSSDPVISLGVVDLLHELLSVVSDLLEVLGVVGDLLISLDVVDPLLKVLIIVGDFFSRVGFALSNVRLTGHPNVHTTRISISQVSFSVGNFSGVLSKIKARETAMMEWEEITSM